MRYSASTYRRLLSLEIGHERLELKDLLLDRLGNVGFHGVAFPHSVI